MTAERDAVTARRIPVDVEEFIANRRPIEPEALRRMERALALYDEGKAAVATADLDMAGRRFTDSLELHPVGRTARRLAAVFEAQGKKDEARELMKRAFELSPNDDLIGVGYARALLETGNAATAASVLRSVLERNGTYGPARRLLSQIE
jgi:predicted Zn-dependent protease